VTSLLLVLAFGLAARDIRLEATPEYLRPDPFGAIVPPDRGAGGFLNALKLEGARGGHVSFHLVVKISQPGPYTLTLRSYPDQKALQAELFREWFHLTESDKQYYPDALIPVQQPYHSDMPEPDNRIAKQTAQAFWVDLWIPPDAEPKTYQTQAILQAAGETRKLNIQVSVLAAVIPNDDVLLMDHNSYGSSWLAEEYPALAKKVGRWVLPER